ncbi:dynamin family protein [Shimia sp. R9_2]|uniref:dynamin family protein n=1 Tax=Shimia sp. R9_2 TaxID=2821112 RepID=UPI001AD99A65|nr:dynamin family protein [Shimia sp. R9_2]MBO9398194.1 dynamin family protein [Shimia sp. R9_2]
MTQPNSDHLTQTDAVSDRKPRIALMGEFSAGKSTLMNLLLGGEPLPVRITATRVPPVWVTFGTEAATRILDDGSSEALEVEEFAEAPVEGTRLIQLAMDADILQLCDLIDIPGISDPNMKHEDWMGLLDEVDCVLWCTHATQAWRQSEAALWEQVSAAVKGPNYLVVTQYDKLRAERDRARVLARLNAETEGLFAAILPIATLDAVNAGQDEEAWKASGGADLVAQIVQALVALTQPERDLGSEVHSGGKLQDEEHPLDADSAIEDAPDEEQATAEAVSQNRVVPRRVRPKISNPERPPAPPKELPPLSVVTPLEDH